MKRTGFKMKLLEGYKDEYIKRHREIWPSVVELLRQQGISNYSIFLDEQTNDLYAYQEQSGASSSQDLGDIEIIKEWWNYMKDIMETNLDNSPVTIPLQEVFHLE